MGRWIAIGRAPGWNDLATFAESLKATEKWRIDPRTTITEVIALADGRLIAECHASALSDIEAWLVNNGWQVDSITSIRHIARTGEIWKVS